MGLSSHPATGYEKKNEAQDIAAVLRRAQDRWPVALVTHDIGNMVGYAFAAQNRDMVSRWVVMDAPLPGLGHWTDVRLDHRDVAFRLLRSGRGAARRRPRAPLPRPFLQ